MSERKPIDVNGLKKVFRIRDGKLERSKPNSKEKWAVVNSKSKNSLTYYKIRFNGRSVFYHVIVWVISTGEDIPEELQIDHINGNRIDNRFENLRLVTQRENCQNIKDHRDGKLCGSSLDRRSGKYRAAIKIGSNRIHLGRYDTELEAHDAYQFACKHITDYVDNSSFRKMIKKEMKERY